MLVKPTTVEQEAELYQVVLDATRSDADRWEAETRLSVSLGVRQSLITDAADRRN